MIPLRALALGLLLVASPAAGQEVRVVDGDTINVDGETFRIVGLDTAEMNSKCLREWRMARAAKRRLEQLLAGGFSTRSQGRDRYGRTLAVVYDAQGRDVAEVLIREGLARRYNGRTRRQSWC